MKTVKIISVFILLVYWSFMISAPVVSKELKTGGSKAINSKIDSISMVKE
ncbi:hypothetical protein [Candidatus Pelagibacter ubique]